MTVKREFELSEEDAAFIDSQAERGTASSDEVLGAAIKMLRDHEELIDRWIRDEVIPSFDQWVADGKPTRSAEEVEAAVEAAIAKAEQRRAS